MTSYEEIQAEVRRRRRERWASIVASEPPGRPAGRRPRDPEQEALLTLLDRLRIERRDLATRSEAPRRGAGSESSGESDFPRR